MGTTAYIVGAKYVINGVEKDPGDAVIHVGDKVEVRPLIKVDEDPYINTPLTAKVCIQVDDRDKVCTDYFTWDKVGLWYVGFTWTEQGPTGNYQLKIWLYDKTGYLRSSKYLPYIVGGGGQQPPQSPQPPQTPTQPPQQQTPTNIPIELIGIVSASALATGGAIYAGSRNVGMSVAGSALGGVIGYLIYRYGLKGG